MSEDELGAYLEGVKRKIRITKVTATRTFKTRNGDYFAGFGAAWNSVQDDHGGDNLITDDEVLDNAMSLKEARIAYYLVAYEADKAAYESACANGSLTQEAVVDAIKAIKHNYAMLIRKALISPEER